MQEQTTNTSPQAATNEPASALLTRLPDALLSDALACGQDVRPDWTQRHDGWTPERIGVFLRVLAQTGVVADAARAVEMSKQSAYAFRHSAKGRAFDVAWRTALQLSRNIFVDELHSRALHGCVDLLERDGVVVARRHRHDNRLAMALLTRLDALAASDSQADEAPRLLTAEFDALVDSVCAGPAAAAEFIRSRCELPEHEYDEENIIRRNADTALHAEKETEEPVQCPSDALPQEPRRVGRKPAADAPARTRGGDRRGRSRRARAAADAANAPPPIKQWRRMSISKEEFDALGEDHDFGENVILRIYVEPDPNLSAAMEQADPAGPSDSPVSGTGDAPAASRDRPLGTDEWQPSTSSTLPAPPPPEPQEQWVVRDDGLTVKMVNGKILTGDFKRMPTGSGWMG